MEDARDGIGKLTGAAADAVVAAALSDDTLHTDGGAKDAEERRPPSISRISPFRSISSNAGDSHGHAGGGGGGNKPTQRGNTNIGLAELHRELASADSQKAINEDMAVGAWVGVLVAMRRCCRCQCWHRSTTR